MIKKRRLFIGAAVAVIAIVLGVLDLTFTLAFDGLADLIN